MPLGVQVVTSHKLLGGFVRVEEGRINYVKELMCDWLHLVDHMTHDQPQAAYAAFTRSVQNK